MKAKTTTKAMLTLCLVASIAIAGCAPQPVGQDDDTAVSSPQPDRVEADIPAPRAEPAASAARIAGSAADTAPPGIAPDVAPGVAFDFRYLFSLPADRIATMQEAHAAQCGALGIARCRVTGLNFTKDRDGSITAMTAFQLDPAIALKFGRDADELVAKAGGRLETGTVTGEDVGSAIVANDKSADGIAEELKRIDAQLKLPNLSRAVRDRLVMRAGELRGQLSGLTRERDDRVAALTMTPVLVTYEPANSLFGLRQGTPFFQAATLSTRSFAAMIEFVALLLGALTPWLLLGAAIWWIVRRLRPRKAAAAGES